MVNFLRNWLASLLFVGNILSCSTSAGSIDDCVAKETKGPDIVSGDVGKSDVVSGDISVYAESYTKPDEKTMITNRTACNAKKPEMRQLEIKISDAGKTKNLKNDHDKLYEEMLSSGRQQNIDHEMVDFEGVGINIADVYNVLNHGATMVFVYDEMRTDTNGDRLFDIRIRHFYTAHRDGRLLKKYLRKKTTDIDTNNDMAYDTKIMHLFNKNGYVTEGVVETAVNRNDADANDQSPVVTRYILERDNEDHLLAADIEQTNGVKTALKLALKYNKNGEVVDEKIKKIAPVSDEDMRYIKDYLKFIINLKAEQ